MIVTIMMTVTVIMTLPSMPCMKSGMSDDDSDTTIMNPHDELKTDRLMDSIIASCIITDINDCTSLPDSDNL